jgi:hypothetical protein
MTIPTRLDSNQLARLGFSREQADVLARAEGIQAYLAARQAAADVVVAQSTADGAVVIANGKNKTFYQTSAPTASAVGDVWFDTDDNFKPYRWDGAAWQLVHDSTPAVSAEIADGAVITQKLADLGVTTAKLNDLAVTTAKLVDAAISSVKLADAAVSSAKLIDGSVITAKLADLGVTTGKIGDDAVTGAKIVADSITTKQLRVFNFENLAQNPGFEDGTTKWTIEGTASVITGGRAPGVKCLKLPAGGGTYAVRNGNEIRCEPGQNFIATAFFNGTGVSSGGATLRLRGKDSSGAETWTTAETSTVAPSGFTVASVTGTVPAGVATVNVEIISRSPVGADVLVDDVYFRRMGDSELIVDGAITTQKLAALAVTAGKIAANTITAAQIAAATITSTEIAALTIVAGNIAAGAITAAKIAAHTITANEIAALTITAAEIAANTITAAKIAANTITAAQIAAGTITATELATDSVIAAKIQAGAVIAGKIAAGAITADKITANEVVAVKISTGQYNTGNLIPNATSEINPPSSYTPPNDGSDAEFDYRFNAGAGAFAGSFVRQLLLSSVGTKSLKRRIPAIAGEFYRSSIRYKWVQTGGTPSASYSFRFLDASLANLSSDFNFGMPTSATIWTLGGADNTLGSAPIGTVWLEFEMKLTTTAAGTAEIWLDEPSLKRMISAIEIESIPGYSWFAPTLLSGWANFGAGWQPAGYSKDGMSTVRLRGVLSNSGGAVANSDIFALPGPMAPANRTPLVAFDVNGTGVIRIDIGTNGHVFTPNAVAAGALYSLNGLSFDTR